MRAVDVASLADDCRIIGAVFHRGPMPCPTTTAGNEQLSSVGNCAQPRVILFPAGDRDPRARSRFLGIMKDPRDTSLQEPTYEASGAARTTQVII